ncbi:MAG: pantoate--beta-alanine ligase [Gemmatimonadota bacterium]
MHLFTTVAELRAWRKAQRVPDKRVGLVPTMGSLHEGHLALVDEARRRSDTVLLTIFVNPLQFGPGEDFERYPRQLDRDVELARARGVDAVFAPPVSEMYRPGAEIRVVPGPTADRWEGAARPGHFTGVLTVVAKLFHLAEPDVACFGQKDIQQVVLVRQMVRDLDWPIELAVVPTVREPDGLALSSRNVYLSETERRHARGLSAALFEAERLWQEGERDAARLEAAMRATLAVYPEVAVEYICVAEPEGLRPVDTAEPGTVVAIAARVGGTRLIDNVVLVARP